MNRDEIREAINSYDKGRNPAKVAENKRRLLQTVAFNNYNGWSNWDTWETNNWLESMEISSVYTNRIKQPYTLGASIIQAITRINRKQRGDYPEGYIDLDSVDFIDILETVLECKEE